MPISLRNLLDSILQLMLSWNFRGINFRLQSIDRSLPSALRTRLKTRRIPVKMLPFDERCEK